MIDVTEVRPVLHAMLKDGIGLFAKLFDFSSEEKSYQTLLQVIGRVGRGHQIKSKIIIQTFDPDSRPLKAAITKNYTTFYNDQLNLREKYLFPPFVFLLKIYCKKPSLDKANKLITT